MISFNESVLERMERTRTATFHLTKCVATDLLGKAAYTRAKGVDPWRFGELVRSFVIHHGAISPKECRELLWPGSSRAAMTEIWRLLSSWSGTDGFLIRQGKPPRVSYILRTGDVTTKDRP